MSDVPMCPYSYVPECPFYDPKIGSCNAELSYILTEICGVIAEVYSNEEN